MEDRQPGGLVLDFVADGAAAPARAAALRSAGLDVSGWTPLVPGRTDVPRRWADDPAVLLVGEDADGTYAGDATVVLRRYPRPSQGSCSGEPTNGLLLVLISPRDPDGAQELRDWGDFVHLRHIAEAGVPGYRTITAYGNAQGAGSEPRWCHFYEMHTDDPEAAYRSMTPLVKQRLGDRDVIRHWATHPQLVIEHVQTYRRRDI
ncbi:MAG TPA: hypothetical protein VHE83_10370 [Mycobacteriales bacterium]|nr:hypothetical protein [Mycobacteriales bacterium]